MHYNWANFGLLLGAVELTSLLLSLFGLLYNFLTLYFNRMNRMVRDGCAGIPNLKRITLHVV